MPDPSPHAFRALRYEVDGPVATITLDRPEALNAFDATLRADLAAALRAVARDRAIRAVILTGSGRAFSAGQDLREVGQGEESSAPDYGTLLRTGYNPLVLALRRLRQPVIAAVNGVAAGAGASLAFACDLRVAAEGASFVLAFGRVGLVPDSGATWLLPRLVGSARAAELILAERSLTAQEAERLGLVSRVVPADRLASEARELAERLAAGPPRALALAKRTLDRSLEVGLPEALEFEAAAQDVAGRTADHREGVRAFLEKRPPDFRGE